MTYILKNVQAICEAASTSLEHVVKRQNYFLDLRDTFATDAPTRDAWPADPPVSTTIQVQGPMSVPGCILTMDVTAAIPDR
jgi:enamine deaminase RidA (YjgF/YER057c/UK114 family)